MNQFESDLIATIREAWPRGTRIRLIETTDEYTHLKRGAEGTVTSVDSMGTVHVRWDDDSGMGLIPGEDRWLKIGD